LLTCTTRTEPTWGTAFINLCKVSPPQR